MSTATLTLHSQRSTVPGLGEQSSGAVLAGIQGSAEYSSALRFTPPVDLDGATISSVKLTVYAAVVESGGGVLTRFGIVNSDTTLAAVDLDAAVASAWSYLHSPNYAFSGSVPAGSQEVEISPTSYEIDLTSSVNVANMVDDIVVLVQHAGFYPYTFDPVDDYLTLDGVGDFYAATLEIVYTPATTGITGDLDQTDGDDVLSSTASLSLNAVVSIAESGDTLSSTGQLHASTGWVITTDANDTLASAGTIPNKGDLATTDADDTLASGCSILITGSSATTDNDDTLVAIADNFSPAGRLLVTEDSDTLSSYGSSSRTANASIVEANDTIEAIAANFVVGGTVNATENNDTLASTSSLLVTAILNASDAGDTVVASGAQPNRQRDRVFLGGGVFLKPYPNPSPVFLGS